MTWTLRPGLQLAGDQPVAVAALSEGLTAGLRAQTLLGVTGSGKTVTVAATLARAARPALVIAPNKTLAAQLCHELRALLPEVAVEYFVSYYDYYRPEAYVASSDLFIEKESARNEAIDALRHAATAALLTRRDVVVVASVSCIYGIGDPARYAAGAIRLAVGEVIDRDALLADLVSAGYVRNDTLTERGGVRVAGETIELLPASGVGGVRIECFGDEIEALLSIDPLAGTRTPIGQALILPAAHHVADAETTTRAVAAIELELSARCEELEAAGRHTEAERLRVRTGYDCEMLRETGVCAGVENYSRHFDGRPAGAPPATLLDYFPDDFVCVIDESHVTLPQIAGMSAGDRARKQTLVEHGFRLPSALDNRPLTGEEFLARVGQLVCVSATPGEWEAAHEDARIEQLIRPTGLCDPRIEVRPTLDQLADVAHEITTRAARGERTLVTTLTKRQAEQLSDYLAEHGIACAYLHSDIDTLERIETIGALRAGQITAIIGVNLLREGLDLPEVSLVAILAADAQGFLRGHTALVQTIGRAARHVDGTAILYADTTSAAMASAIAETDRRRAYQQAHNHAQGITPTAVRSQSAPQSLIPTPAAPTSAPPADAADRAAQIAALETRMLAAADALRFEDAARHRDAIAALLSA